MTTYRVSEAAKLVHLSVDTLQYYEKIGLIPGVMKDKRGYKAYSEKNILSLRFALNLKKTGMPLSDIIQYTDWFAAGKLDECYSLLSGHASVIKEQIEEKENFLKVLQHKLTNFAQLIENRRDQFDNLDHEGE